MKITIYNHLTEEELCRKAQVLIYEGERNHPNNPLLEILEECVERMVGLQDLIEGSEDELNKALEEVGSHEDLIMEMRQDIIKLENDNEALTNQLDLANRVIARVSHGTNP